MNNIRPRQGERRRSKEQGSKRETWEGEGGKSEENVNEWLLGEGSTWEAESKENEMRSVVVVKNIRVLSSGKKGGEVKSEDRRLKRGK